MPRFCAAELAMRKSGEYSRRASRGVSVGRLSIGGGAGISVQTMTNTDTRDVAATVAQINSVMDAGCDLVRVAVPDAAAAEALRAIRAATEGAPLVADIHFDYRLALAALNAGMDGLRLNPGNIGGEDRVRAVVKAAARRGTPIRIGVNGGSLEADILERHGEATAEAMVESALRHVALLEEAGHEAIKISVKSSRVMRTVEAYRLLAERVPYALHLGLTEAGTLYPGTIRSCAALGALLSEGIGDTIRISLTDAPEEEVRAGLELLRALELRGGGVRVTSCPTCARSRADVAGVARAVEERLVDYFSGRPDAPRPKVAVMGCVVNGPGEARDADIALVGAGEERFLLYIRGERREIYPASEAVRVVLDAARDMEAARR